MTKTRALGAGALCVLAVATSAIAQQASPPPAQPEPVNSSKSLKLPDNA